MILQVKVQPGSKVDKVLGWKEDILRVAIQAPPEKGQANKALIKFLARVFKVKKNDLKLLSGKTSRLKRLECALTEKELLEKINQQC